MPGRDRLAEYRAAGQLSPVSPISPTYPSPPHLPPSNYELNTIERGQRQQVAWGDAPGAGEKSQVDPFLDEFQSINDSIAQLHSSIARIVELEFQELNTVRPVSSSSGDVSPVRTELEYLRSNTSRLSTSIRNRLIALIRFPLPPTASAFNPSHRAAILAQRETRIKGLQARFTAELNEYQSKERENRDRQRARLTRQARIVLGPEAEEEDVRQAIREAEENGEGGSGLFKQALASGRYGEARTAYRDVQARSDDIKRIERSLIELGQLVQEISNLAFQQDDKLKLIDEGATQVELDTRHGNEQLSRAKKLAEAVRRKKWWCFWISVLIIIIIVVVVAVYFGAVKP